MDYVTAQQDRHSGNIYLRDRPGGGREVAGIDQDAAFPNSAVRFDPHVNAGDHRHQRPIPDTVSRAMEGRLRDLARHWPETELRQWLTQDETDGARARLAEIVDGLDNHRITVTP